MALEYDSEINQYHQTLRFDDNNGGFSNMSVSNDNLIYVSSKNSVITKYDAARYCVKGSFNCKQFGVNLIESTNYDNMLLTADKRVDNRIYLLDFQAQKYMNTFVGHDDPIKTIQRMAEEKFMSFSGRNGIKIWDFRSRMEVNRIHVYGNCIGHTHPMTNTMVLGVSSERLIFYHLQYNNAYQDFDLRGIYNTGVWTGMSISPNGNLLVIDAMKCKIVIDAYTGILLFRIGGFKNDRNEHLQSQFSLDSNYLFGGSSDSKIYIWSMETGKCVWTKEDHTPSEESMKRIAINYLDGYLITGCRDLAIWKLRRLERENNIDNEIQEHSRVESSNVPDAEQDADIQNDYISISSQDSPLKISSPGSENGGIESHYDSLSSTSENSVSRLISNISVGDQRKENDYDSISSDSDNPICKEAADILDHNKKRLNYSVKSKSEDLALGEMSNISGFTLYKEMTKDSSDFEDICYLINWLIVNIPITLQYSKEKVCDLFESTNWKFIKRTLTAIKVIEKIIPANIPLKYLLVIIPNHRVRCEIIQEAREQYPARKRNDIKVDDMVIGHRFLVYLFLNRVTEMCMIKLAYSLNVIASTYVGQGDTATVTLDDRFSRATDAKLMASNKYPVFCERNFNYNFQKWFGNSAPYVELVDVSIDAWLTQYNNDYNEISKKIWYEDNNNLGEKEWQAIVKDFEQLNGEEDEKARIYTNVKSMIKRENERRDRLITRMLARHYARYCPTCSYYNDYDDEVPINVFDVDPAEKNASQGKNANASKVTKSLTLKEYQERNAKIARENAAKEKSARRRAGEQTNSM